MIVQPGTPIIELLWVPSVYYISLSWVCIYCVSFYIVSDIENLWLPMPLIRCEMNVSGDVGCFWEVGVLFGWVGDDWGGGRGTIDVYHHESWLSSLQPKHNIRPRSAKPWLQYNLSDIFVFI